MAQKTKQQIVIDAMTFSRFGAMSQLFVADVFMKNGAQSRDSETNTAFAERAMIENPALVAELEAHAELIVRGGRKALEAAFAETGADKWCNPAAWFGVAEEITAKLARSA